MVNNKMIPRVYTAARRMVTHIITERCNLNCRMCFQSNIRKKNKPEIPFDRIVDFYKKHQTEIMAVNITGGEPFIRPDCIDLLEILDLQNFMITINTNGTLISGDIAERLGKLRHLRSINISIDGLQDVHEAIRRKHGIYDKTIAAIALLRQNVKPNVLQVNTMILPENVEELDLHISFIESLGVKRIELIFPGSYSRKEIENSQCILDKFGIPDVNIDTAEQEEFKKIPIQSTSVVSSVLEKHSQTKIIVVPKSFLTNTELFLDDDVGNYNIGCAKLKRKELRINSVGEIIFCDTLRKPLIMFDQLESLGDVNKIPELIALKNAIIHGLPCCKRCCKSAGLALKQRNVVCQE